MKKLIPISTPLESLITRNMCHTSIHMREIVEVDESNLGASGIEGSSWHSDYSGLEPNYHEGHESYRKFYCAECGRAITVTIRSERNSDIDEGLINPQKDVRAIYQASVEMFLSYFPGEGIPSIDPNSPNLDILRLEAAMALLTRVDDAFSRTDVNLYRLNRFIEDDLDSLLTKRRNLTTLMNGKIFTE